MRRIALALFAAVICSARLASGAAISLAGADCGTPELLGLSFNADVFGASASFTSSTACPGVAIGSILGPTGSPLYGGAGITSVEFAISDPSQLDGGLTILPGSQLSTVTFTPTGFILSGGPIGTCGFFTPTADATGIHPCADVAIRFEGFDPGTSFTVTSVNDQAVSTVPEPATLSLLLAGGAAARWRLRRTSRRRV
jgi:hypothetical protein